MRGISVFLGLARHFTVSHFDALKAIGVRYRTLLGNSSDLFKGGKKSVGMGSTRTFFNICLSLSSILPKRSEGLPVQTCLHLAEI